MVRRSNLAFITLKTCLPKIPYVHDLSPTAIIHVSLSQFKQSERRVGEADVQLLYTYNRTKTQSNYLHAGFDSSSTNTPFVIYMSNIEASNYTQDKLLPNILNYTNTQIEDFPIVIKATSTHEVRFAIGRIQDE